VTRRLISAAVLISVFVLLLWIDYWLGTPDVLGRMGIPLCLVSVFLASLAASEFTSLWGLADSGSKRVGQDLSRVPNSKQLTIAAMVMVFIACCLPVILVSFDETQFALEAAVAKSAISSTTLVYQPAFFSLMGLLAAFALAIGYEMSKYQGSSASVGLLTDRLGRSVLVFVYLITLFGFVIPHRWLEGNNALGLISIIALIVTVKMSDSCALFAGKALGTIKLAPKLSPGKTIQGVVGGFAGGALGMAIVFFAVAPLIFGIRVERPIGWFVLYTICIVTAGILGDLTESMFKRDAGRKDSSSWIPGLGGVLDVLDSLVLACPISFLLWMM
jgi:phosphatidate cytidylyltransferase